MVLMASLLFPSNEEKTYLGKGPHFTAFSNPGGPHAGPVHDAAATVAKKKREEKKSRIRETSNLSTDADRRTDTILERLRDLSKKKLKQILEFF